MTLQDVLADLAINNQRSAGFYSLDQLKALVAQMSVETAYNSTARVTLAYSGNLAADGSGPSATVVAERIGADDPSRIRTIGQTDAAKLLLSEEFIEAVQKSAGSSSSVNEILYGARDGSRTRITTGLWDDVSRRFILAAPQGSELRSITPFARADGVFGTTELPSGLR